MISLTDPARRESLNTQEAPEASRRFPVSVFYPAEAGNELQQKSSVLSLFEPAVERSAELFAMVGLAEERLRATAVPIYNDAPPARTDKPLPVVVFAPGFGVDRDLYVRHIAALVQAGFLVVTVGATYDTLFTVFPDGDVEMQSPRCSGQDFTDFPTLRELVRVRQADVQFTLTQLPLWNEGESPLNGLFDLERIGLMGHSLGGAGVFGAAQADSQIRAVVLLDASLHVLPSESPISFPVLNVRQEAASLEEMLQTEMNDKVARAMAEGQQRLHDLAGADRCFVKIQGADHMTFSTIPALFQETEKLTRGQEAIQAVTVAFLEEFAGGRAGRFADFLAGGERPAQVLEIDRDGHLSRP
ncbi:hypothetical protein EL26_02240 [Tumebacillus flagellatus]|uniref:PET hydrolase/cutinase-like domain-containing protein n=1 Tax=Tumebacillus flagellatus TaxID=1157490 RepID=A0A074LV63_9BACL|nr:hypothetical protein EL26_02240 [Tumebacillus flagellatus]